MAEQSVLECTSHTVHDLTMQELVIDVRRDRYSLTAEACCTSQAGVNLCLHAGPEADPNELVSELIEGIEKLGIKVLRYRVVREDLPPRVVIEFRKTPGSEGPGSGAVSNDPAGHGREEAESA